MKGGVLLRSGSHVTETINHAHKTSCYSNMVGAKHLTPCQIAVITALCKAEHSNNNFSQQTGVALQTVERLLKKFKDARDGNVELNKIIPGRPRKHHHGP